MPFRYFGNVFSYRIDCGEKNRKPQTPFCVGADTNRNFDWFWSETGASKNPCSETYAGPKPFSEPESLALAQFVKSFNNIQLHLTFHSYGQMLLFPYVRLLNINFKFETEHSLFFSRGIQLNVLRTTMTWYEKLVVKLIQRIS